MNFRSRLFLYFFPVIILTVAAALILFIYITRNQFLANQQMILGLQNNAIESRLIHDFDNLEELNLMRNEYFRGRVLQDITADFSKVYGHRPFFIFDQEGEIILQSEDSRGKVNSEIKNHIAQNMGVESTRIFHSDNQGKPIAFQYTYTSSQVVGLTLVSFSELRNAMAPLYNAITYTLLVVGGILVAVFFIFYRLSSGFTAPLAKLNEAVLLVADGELNVKITEQYAIRELHDLASVFNLMSENLHREMEKRIAYEKELSTSLKEKETLLQEVHHRVKNNLQIIISLLNLQSGNYADPAVQNALSIAMGRVNTMSLIHERVYQTRDFSRISLAEYLDDLIPPLTRMYPDKSVFLDLQIDALSLNLSRAVPFGLIINEFITNSLKYAFNDGSKGTIGITLRKKTQKIQCLYRDSGPGVPADINIGSRKTLGLELVKSLAAQMGGTYEIKTIDGNTVQVIEF